MDKSTPTVVKSHDINIDKEYIGWVEELKSRYRRAQIKAAVKVNAEQLLFNWQLGRDLVIRKAEEKWAPVLLNKSVWIFRQHSRNQRDSALRIYGG